MVTKDEQDYISLTDMVRPFGDESMIQNWMRNLDNIEFLGLKEEEYRTKQLEWNLQRTLAKINYRIHTDAIKENLIPPKVSKSRMNYIYAVEADLLNVALFGKTAKEWR